MNEQGFLELAEAHKGIIHKICRLCRDTPEDREDLFQEIIYQLWKAVPSFRGDAKISSWLYRVAINTALAAFRKRRPDILPESEIPHTAEEAPDGTAEAKREQWFSALKKLDESERAIVILFLDDLSYRQISEITGITENNVGVRLNRIKNKLQWNDPVSFQGLLSFQIPDPWPEHCRFPESLFSEDQAVCGGVYFIPYALYGSVAVLLYLWADIRY